MSSAANTDSKNVRLDKAQVLKATKALVAHLNKEKSGKNELIESNSIISMNIQLRKMPLREISKPVKIPLPNTLLNPNDGIEICIISKDPTDELKEKLLKVPVAGVTKVLSVNKLKKEYHDFAKRRELVSQYNAFFCDDRVIPMMPKLCGKSFSARNKFPTPVRVSGSAASVAKEVVKARDSTYMVVGKGQTIAIRIGHSGMSGEQVAANIMAAIGPAVEHIPKKWKNVASVHIQGSHSVALPIYKSLSSLAVIADDEAMDEMDELSHGLGELSEEDMSDFEGDDSDEEEEEEEEEVAPKKTGGKRSRAVDEEEEDKVPVKAKKVSGGEKKVTIVENKKIPVKKEEKKEVAKSVKTSKKN